MASQLNNHGVKTFVAGEALAADRRVKLDSSQECVYADADDVGIGVTVGAAAHDGHVAVLLDNAPGTRRVTVSAGTDAADVLWAVDDGKCEDTATSDGPSVYEAIEAGSGSGSVIEGVPIGRHGSRLLYAQVADGTALTGTTDETVLSTRTIDGSILRAGDVLEVIFRGFISATTGAYTYTGKLYVGTELIVTTDHPDATNSDSMYVHAFITVRIAGSGGHLSASGVEQCGAATIASYPWRKDDAAEDLSGDVAIKVTGTCSNSSGSMSMYSEDFIIILHRQ